MASPEEAQPEYRQFNSVSDAVNFLTAEVYMECKKLDNMVITSHSLVQETSNNREQVLTSVGNRNPCYTSSEDTPGCMAGYLQAQLSAFDQIFGKFGNPYIIEFNTRSPFLDIQRVRNAERN